MSIPTPVVSEEEWRRERAALLIKETELTRARDALAAERRRLPTAPFGRQEEWAGSCGTPSGASSWAGRHDEYSPEELAGGRTS